MATHRPDISIRYKITGITSAPLNELTYLLPLLYSSFSLVASHFIYYIMPYSYVILFAFYRFDLDGTRVSVVQYFKRQYDYSLKYIQWPCLQAGSDSRPTYLPMEVSFFFKS